MSGGDNALTQSVTNSLATAGISPQTLNNVHVRTFNGRVILTGQVDNQNDRQQIETQVRQIPGVRMVINQLRVAGGDAAGTGGLGAGAGTSGAGAGAGNQNSGASSPGNSGTPPPAGDNTPASTPGPR